MIKSYATLALIFFVGLCSAQIFEVNNIAYSKTSTNPPEVAVERRQALYQGVVSIPNQIFWNDTLFTVRKIAYEAFFKCKELENVILPNTIQFISSRAFASSSIQSLHIPQSVNEIGLCAFWDCTAMQAYTVDANNPAYSADFGVLYNKDKSVLIKHPGKPNYTNFTVPVSVHRIEPFAFSFAKNLIKIELHDGIDSIPYNAFNDCTSLQEVVMSPELKHIGGAAFQNCASLTSVTFPTAITKIELLTYSGCGSLKQIIIPETIDSIGYGAFSACSGVDKIILESDSLYIDEWAFSYCTGLDSLVCCHTSLPTVNFTSFWYVGIAPHFGMSPQSILVIPFGTLPLYRDSIPWGFFMMVESDYCSEKVDTIPVVVNRIYPNPATDWVIIESTQPVIQALLLDTMGRIIYEQKSSTAINVSAYPRGTYLIQVITQTGTFTEKLVLW